MKDITFVKMVGSGNDFIVIDNVNYQLPITGYHLPEFVKEVCQRKQSIGADGVLLLEHSEVADLKMRVFNPDGSEVAMCGNGSRCVALFAYQNEIGSDGKIIIETRAGNIYAEVRQNNVRIKMSDPKGLRLNFNLNILGQMYRVSFIDTGVPHLVCIVQRVDECDVQEIGKAIRYHPEFQPEGTNADFVEMGDESHIRVRTYERGVEQETLACGTGAVAAAIISSYEKDKWSLGAHKVTVDTRGGEALTVYFTKTRDGINEVYLEGQARVVYRGKINEDTIYRAKRA